MTQRFNELQERLAALRAAGVGEEVIEEERKLFLEEAEVADRRLQDNVNALKRYLRGKPEHDTPNDREVWEVYTRGEEIFERLASLADELEKERALNALQSRRIFAVAAVAERLAGLAMQKGEGGAELAMALAELKQAAAKKQ